MTKGKVPQPGTLLKIPMESGKSGFARVLPNYQLALYAIRTDENQPLDRSAVTSTPVIAHVTVRRSALVSGRWPVVDFWPLESTFESPTYYFVRDPITGEFSLYRSSDGLTTKSSFEECANLEAAAVWEAEHVESRLEDYFAGRPNKWVEQLRAHR